MSGSNNGHNIPEGKAGDEIRRCLRLPTISSPEGMIALPTPALSYQLLESHIEIYELPLCVTEADQGRFNIDFSYPHLQPRQFLLLAAGTKQVIGMVILHVPADVDWSTLGGTPYYGVDFPMEMTEMVRQMTVSHLQDSLGLDLGVPVEKISAAFEWLDKQREAEAARRKLNTPEG